MKDDAEKTNIIPLDEIIPVSLSGWYCPRCDMWHPQNMACGPAALFWDEKKKDYIAVGQKLSYYQ